MASDKTALVVGGVLVVGVVAYLLYQKQQSQLATLNDELANVSSLAPSGNILSDVLSGISGVVGGSSLSSLSSAFSSTTSSNDAGLLDDDEVDSGANDPGLEDDDYEDDTD